MKYVSLFAGIGGFDLALNKLGHECVYVNEWDKYATATYEKNFNHTVDTRSITEVPAESIPDHDLLVGGFPCQAFSIAGKRRGFDETRGTLFFDIARILKAKQTRFVLLENVKGLLSHDNGRTFKVIISTLVELGYDLQWQVLNSKDFGVPQNRERIFIIGHLRGQPRPKVFPIIQDSSEDAVTNETSGTPENEIAGTLTVHYTKNQHGSQYVAEDDQENRRVKVGTWRTHKDGRGFREVKSGLSPTIPARAREDGSGQPVVMAWSKSTRDWGTEERIKTSGEFNTLSTGDGGGNQSTMNYVSHDLRLRRLTPTECERLQGFPDGWTEGVSVTQQYKQLGNAVTVNVVEAIMRKFDKSLLY